MCTIAVCSKIVATQLSAHAVELANQKHSLSVSNKTIWRRFKEANSSITGRCVRYCKLQLQHRDTSEHDYLIEVRRRKWKWQVKRVSINGFVSSRLNTCTAISLHTILVSAFFACSQSENVFTSFLAKFISTLNPKLETKNAGLVILCINLN